MNRYTIALATLAISTTAALAQNAAPAARPATPAPIVSTPANPATPAALPSTSTSGNATLAQTAAAARQMFTTRATAKEATCKGKGALYAWKAPHAVGDANPAGGFYSTNSAGSCRLISMKKAIEAGLVTVRTN
jgi:hypothetical protein